MRVVPRGIVYEGTPGEARVRRILDALAVLEFEIGDHWTAKVWALTLEVGRRDGWKERPMTEAEWLICEDPTSMLRLLQEKGHHRGLWLFAAACCELGLIDLPEEIRELILPVAQGVANRSVKPVDLWLAFRQAVIWKEQFVANQEFDRAACARDWHLLLADGYPTGETLDEFIQVMGSGIRGVHERGFRAARWAIGYTWDREHPSGSKTEATDIRLHLDLLRDLFGNPFRPVAVEIAERTPTVLALAEGIDNERAFDRLPILGDALEDAGCTDAAILDHCRGAGLHIRGCWLLDLLLDKT